MAKIVGWHYNCPVPVRKLSWNQICKVDRDLGASHPALTPFSEVGESRSFGRKSCPDSNSLMYNKKCPFFVLFHSQG